MTNMPSIHIHLPEDLKQALKEEAKKENTSVAKLVIKAVKRYLRHG